MDRFKDDNGQDATLVQIVGEGAATPALTNADTTGAAITIAAGEYFWSAWGTWDGATAQLQFSPDQGTTWIDVDGAALTANGGFSHVGLGSGQARVAISGAGASTEISSSLQKTG